MKKLITILLVVMSIQSFGQAGSLDATFGTGGIVTTPIGSAYDVAWSVLIQSDEKIVVAGQTYNSSTFYDFALVRYNTDGSLDNTFGSSGKVTTDFSNYSESAYSVALQNDGKLIVAGGSSTGSGGDFALYRYNTNGTLDNTFGTSGRVTTAIGSSYETVYSISIQSDGKIVAAGVTYNGFDDDFALVRYNTNGSLDNTFGTGGKVTTSLGNSDDRPRSIFIQSDGKIIVAGNSKNGSITNFSLVRYNTDGTLDNAFGTAGIVFTAIGAYDNIGKSISAQSDGKIVMAGFSNNGGATSYNFTVVRYNSDGSMDNTFGTSGKATTDFGNSLDYSSAMSIQNDDKIILAGSSGNGSNNHFALTCYNADGTLDNTFGTAGKVVTVIGSIYDDIYSTAIQSDGKIVVAGYYNNGTDHDFAIARYNKATVNVNDALNFSDRTISVYPNPSNGKFQVQSLKFKVENIEVYNLLGEKVFQSTINNQNSTIDISSQPNGIYFIHLKIENKIITQKLVVSH